MEKKIITVMIIGIFVAILGTPLFYIAQSVYPYTFSKTLFFQAIAEIIFFCWAGLAVLDQKFLPKKTPLMIAGGLFLLALTATSALGVDWWRSFWSTQERTLGIFTWAHFFALAMIFSVLGDKIQWKKLLYSSFAVASFIGILGFIQLKVPDLLLNEPVGDRPGSTFGNPTFFAGYLLVNICLAIFFLIKNGERRKEENQIKKTITRETLFLVGTLLIQITALFNTQTRGDILGFAVAAMAATTLFMFSPPKLGQKILSRKSTYAGLLILILTVGAGVWFSRFNPFWEHVPGLSRLKDISLSDASLLPRRVALSVAWQGFLEKPLTGWGWENFNIVFNKHYDPRLLSAGYQETRFDKPHNAILEYLVTGGLPLFLAFIGLSIAFIFEVYKNRDKTFAVMMTALLCGYIVRNAFVFDTVGPVMMMMMVFGWVDWQYWKNRERSQTQTTVTTTQKKNQREDEDGREVIALLLCCASIIPVYFFNILSLEASYYQYQGFNSFVHNKSYAGISNFKTAIEIYSPYTGNFKRDYAIAAAEAHFGSPGSVKKQDVLDAIAGMEQTTSEHPLDAYNHYSLVDLYNQVSDLDKENFTRKAEEHAARALNLSPDRQEVLFSLAKTKTLEKKYPEAIELLKKAISLNENIADAQFYYGLVSYAAGDQGEGYKGIKKGLELGRKWKNANEAIVVANFFADSGHIDGAIDLYRKATELDASNLEAKIKLGIAYYVKGDRENAKKYIEQTINQFDITKSNSYEDIVPILIDLGLAVH